MKLFITGGGGFLGCHIKKELDKYSVNYLAPRSSEVNVLDFNELFNYLKHHRPDTILALAAICGGIIKNSHIPADFLRENTQMALNTFEAARQNNITNIYSIGSVCMYPCNATVPFKEDDLWNGYPEKTNAPYSQAKRTLLMLSQTYRAQYGFTGAHLIPVNMYGPGDSFDDEKSHVIPALIKKIINAKENNLPIVECIGGGTSTREFIFSRDSSEIIVKSILTNFDCDLPINIGVGKDITIKNLAYLIKELTNYKGDISFKDDGMDGQKTRRLDVSRAKELLGWQATTGLREGLIQTIDWYIKNK